MLWQWEGSCWRVWVGKWFCSEEMELLSEGYGSFITEGYLLSYLEKCRGGGWGVFLGNLPVAVFLLGPCWGSGGTAELQRALHEVLAAAWCWDWTALPCQDHQCLHAVSVWNHHVWNHHVCSLPRLTMICCSFVAHDDHGNHQCRPARHVWVWSPCLSGNLFGATHMVDRQILAFTVLYSMIFCALREKQTDRGKVSELN